MQIVNVLGARPRFIKTSVVIAAFSRTATMPRQLHPIESVGYLGVVPFKKCTAVIVTNPCGVQEEAFFYRKPCVTLSGETEWVELVEAGWNRLTPPACAAAGSLHSRSGGLYVQDRHAVWR